MAKQVNTGIMLSIVAATPATNDKAGYDALTHIEVGELTAIPEFGADTAVVESNPLKTGITEKFKGFTNYGSINLEFDFDAADLGQQTLESGSDGANKTASHSVRLTYPDGSVRDFQGKVFSFKENPGGQNSMVTGSAMFEIDTPILRTNA